MSILQRKKGSKQRSDMQRVQELYQELVSKTPKCVGTYMLDRTIGQGSFGKIKLALHALTGQQVALKVIDKTHAHAVVREVEHWRCLNHPHIVRLYELLTTETKIYLAMEYASRGDLLLWVNKVGRPTGGDARKWFRQTADAVAYLHRRNLVHRDLKLENILLDDQLDVKLIDFGFTREFDQRRMLESYCGSMAYAAPEMISGQRYSGPEADIWSLGVILYTMLCGRLPFDDDDPMKTNRKIITGDYVMPEDVDSDAAHLIRSMLQVRPKDRIDIERILAHPWLFRVTEADDETSPDAVPDPTQGRRSSEQMQSSTLSLIQTFAHTMPHMRTPPLRKGSAPTLQTEHLVPTDPLSARSSSDSLDEGELVAMLGRVGINAQAMERSVRRDACDSLTALYYILAGRFRRRDRVGIAPTAPSSMPATLTGGARYERSASHRKERNGARNLFTPRFNRSNPDDLSSLDAKGTPPPIPSIDAAARKSSLPWLSFGSSSSASSSTTATSMMSMTNATAAPLVVPPMASAPTNNSTANPQVTLDSPIQPREKERRSRSPNRLSTLFRDLRRRGGGSSGGNQSSSKERSPDRQRWQQWSSDPTLLRRAREMLQPSSAPSSSTASAVTNATGSVPAIHVRHSSKDSLGLSVHAGRGDGISNKARDTRSRSFGDLRVAANDRQRVGQEAGDGQPLSLDGDENLSAVSLVRSESERSAVRGGRQHDSRESGDDTPRTSPALNNSARKLPFEVSPAAATAVELNTQPLSPLSSLLAEAPGIATVPLRSWKTNPTPARPSAASAFPSAPAVTRRNLLSAVRSGVLADTVPAASPSASSIAEVSGIDMGDDVACHDAAGARTTSRTKPAPALAMMIEEEDEEENEENE